MAATATRKSTAAPTMSAVSITGANAGRVRDRTAVGGLASDLALALSVFAWMSAPSDGCWRGMGRWYGVMASSLR